MTTEWQASAWGRLLTKTEPWRLHVEDDRLFLRVDDNFVEIQPENLPSVEINRGVLWTDITLREGRTFRVDGLPNSKESLLREEISRLLTISRRKRFQECYACIRTWLSTVAESVQRADSHCLWLTHEMQQELLAAKPILSLDDQALAKLFQTAEVQSSLSDGDTTVEQDLGKWMCDWAEAWARRNDDHMLRELEACKALLAGVESKPLTDEQSRAVICFDNRVQVIASAGSGKTSTMVAKAVYALHRKLVFPSSIVMLAFNKSAAEELQARVALSLERVAIEDVQIEAKTFHSLGLSIIAEATGRKPHVPEWAVENMLGFQKLMTVVDDLKDQSEEFRAEWDLFRLVLGREIPAVSEDQLFEAWDKEGQGRLVSLKGDHVASQEERVIANWLFYNGINYQYEHPYEHDTATVTHRHYFPDFFYPDIDLYHEHFALDASGQAPEHFKGYVDGVEWKRETHQKMGTALMETTSYQLHSGEIFKHLANELTARGLVLDPNPDRSIPAKGMVPLEHVDLVKLIRTFITHFKSNSLTIDSVHDRLEHLPTGAFRYRFEAFLKLALPVLNGWNMALSLEKGIDFEDMINMAAEVLERGHPSPYSLVMADEYQDASRARARLCRALVAEPGRHLFAVGDDWQSINRFAGADISVMTGFREWFGHGQIYRLETTFRCPQEICDVSSRFVSKNPSQLAKRVKSVTPALEVPIQAFQVPSRNEIQGAINHYLSELHARLTEGAVPLGKSGKVTVFILGRYRNDRQYIPEYWQQDFGDLLDVKFKTIHTSKGDEAEYVVLPGMVSRGFPSIKSDDSLLELVMPAGDTYQHSEERRLFYVALTRARRSVAMFTVMGKNSPFLDEMVKEGAIKVTSIRGEQIKEERCPVCKTGVIVPRQGPYGDFRSCSSYPMCSHKPKLPMKTTSRRASSSYRGPW
ncbi:UvrD-helicase domain-containing protein [Pseudomonas graminis]|uniref:UvrD-helicase domain-containing protein n=1 Tax=Pseudomonas graminis TaxID=158627 RepID=UPI00234A6B9C|nr:UvrD-helicase domain-containing protein [Pseudomonas graminis]MDC6379867.1 UvrD-helicase domain-containing protein [Pseudomonas graminis]